MTPYETHAGVCGITRVPASTPRDLRRSSGDTFLAEPAGPVADSAATKERERERERISSRRRFCEEHSA